MAKLLHQQRVHGYALSDLHMPACFLNNVAIVIMQCFAYVLSAALETILNKTSTDGKYCVGDSLTIADCCLVPQVWNAYER